MTGRTTWTTLLLVAATVVLSQAVACQAKTPENPAENSTTATREKPLETLELANDVLEVSLGATRPVPLGYQHKPTGAKFDGATAEGTFVINGESIPWDDWQVNVRRDLGGQRVVYEITLSEKQIKFQCAFSLQGNVLRMELGNVSDPDGRLKTIAWQNLPMLVCKDSQYRFWRMLTGGPDATLGKMWTGESGGQIASSGPGDAATVIHGCLFKPEELCAFVHSNYPLFPVTHRITGEKHYELSLNTYQYRVRDKTMPPLVARVVFAADQNGDRKTDLADYCLWMNRQLPDADSIYDTHIWYKIFMDHHTGMRTTIDQAREMIEAIANVTDGLPQIPYLVGWQEGGHDHKYPSMGTVNRRIGGPAALGGLFTACKQRYNTILSYHQNIDDAYEDSNDWDPDFCGPKGICHTMDVEKGAVFRRLDTMLSAIPVEKTLHFDNMRITNTHTAEGFRHIGIMEELVCGLMPIMDYLRKKGITITTEGQNGMPCDASLVVQGFWHFDIPGNARQLFHRKLVGGGGGSRVVGPSRMDCAMGYGIHQDFSYWPLDRESVDPETWKKNFYWFNGPRGLTVSFEKEWPEIVDRIYLGVLLYHFYLEREMVNWEGVPGGLRVTYGPLPGKPAEPAAVAQCVNNHLTVTLGDVLVAENEDRFIPRGDAIYAYSRGGSERDWVLPEKFRGKELELFTLSKEGRGPAPTYKVEGNRIQLKLDPRTPVKIMVGK